MTGLSSVQKIGPASNETGPEGGNNSPRRIAVESFSPTTPVRWFNVRPIGTAATGGKQPALSGNVQRNRGGQAARLIHLYEQPEVEPQFSHL